MSLGLPKSDVLLSEEDWRKLGTTRTLPVSRSPTTSSLRSKIGRSTEGTVNPESRESKLSLAAAGRSERSGYLSNPIWDIMHEVMYNMRDLLEAVKEALPESEDRREAGYDAMYATYMGLFQAQTSVRKHPRCRNWTDDIFIAQFGRKQLEDSWGTEGESSNEIVKEAVEKHWPAIRERLMEIEVETAILRFKFCPRLPKQKPHR